LSFWLHLSLQMQMMGILDACVAVRASATATALRVQCAADELPARNVP
jgi:hypothetical protein